LLLKHVSEKTAPNNQTKQRQTTKRNSAKQPNETSPNNQTKLRQITKLSPKIFVLFKE
jgi:hypothetical protein